MSEQRFDVVFRGEVLPGFDAATVGENLQKLFKASPEAIARLMGGGAHAVKKGTDHATALKYQSAMERAGAKAELRQLPEDAATPQPPPQVMAPDSTPASLSLAAPGSDILSEDERIRVAPVEVDISHIGLASIFGQDTEDQRPPLPPAPDTSHLSVAEAGADLLADREAQPLPAEPDTSMFSLADSGARLGPEPDDTPMPVPDVSAITLAPPGAPLDELRPSKTPLNPDISGLELEQS